MGGVGASVRHSTEGNDRNAAAPTSFVVHGDCLNVLRSMPGNYVDAIVTDPPYGISFMGKRWDYDVPSVDVWRECLRVLKPGGHMLVACGTRTQHRMVVNMEDAGFEIRDVVTWLYGQGMPKGWNFDNRVPKEEWCDCPEPDPEHQVRPLREADLSTPEHVGDERGQVLFASVSESSLSGEESPQGKTLASGRQEPGLEGRSLRGTRQGLRNDSCAEASARTSERLRAGACARGGEDARPSAHRVGGSASHKSRPSGQSSGESQGVREPRGALGSGALLGCGACARCGKLSQAFHGFDVALKPSCEFWTLCRKPLSEPTVAKNVLKWGTGALNIDGCRVGKEIVESGRGGRSACETCSMEGGKLRATEKSFVEGRFPANLILDEEAAQALDAQTANQRAAKPSKSGTAFGTRGDVGFADGHEPRGYEDSGGASRFFYVAKASKSDRGAGNGHPTVKPTTLMAYLCRLVTPPGGLVLDPFTGSGSTGVGAVREGFRFVGIEREADYAGIAAARVRGAK